MTVKVLRCDLIRGAKHEPVRMCVGCGKRGSARELIRLVARPLAHNSYELVVDTARRLPGRGVWLHHDEQCAHMATRRNAFSRGLRVSGKLETVGALQTVGD